MQDKLRTVIVKRRFCIGEGSLHEAAESIAARKGCAHNPVGVAAIPVILAILREVLVLACETVA